MNKISNEAKANKSRRIRTKNMHCQSATPVIEKNDLLDIFQASYTKPRNNCVSSYSF